MNDQPSLDQLQNAVFGKTRNQIEQELRDTRTLISRAIRHFDQLTDGEVMDLATTAQQLQQRCGDSIEAARRRGSGQMPSPAPSTEPSRSVFANREFPAAAQPPAEARPGVRSNVFLLLTRVDFNGSLADVKRWTHQSGRPLTRSERDLAGSATASELQAVASYLREMAERQQRETEAFTRIEEIAGPHLVQLPAGAVLRDVLPLLSDADRAEYERLLAPAAPDGKVAVPRKS